MTLSEWNDLKTFNPVILWPEPEEISLLFPPRYIEGGEYVELVYSEEFIASAVETPIYTLYVSHTNIPLGHSFLPDYASTKSQVTTSNVRLKISGSPVEVQILENPHLPESGVAIFELNKTHIFFHWRQKSRTAALAMLEQSLTQVEPNDSETISSFDHMLKEKFSQPDNDDSSKITQTVAVEKTLESTILALLSANTFPGFDIDMLHRDGDLERDNVADNSPQQIVTGTIEHVELTSGSSLLMTILDDDPICVASVDATATTEEGETLQLTMPIFGIIAASPPGHCAF